MENKLTIWIHSKYTNNLLNKIKNAISDQYQLNESDYFNVPEGNGFVFTYDDESSGDTTVLINDQGDTHTIQISGTFDWEVVTVYHLVLDLLDKIIKGDELNENHSLQQ